MIVLNTYEPFFPSGMGSFDGVEELSLAEFKHSFLSPIHTGESYAEFDALLRQAEGNGTAHDARNEIARLKQAGGGYCVGRFRDGRRKQAFDETNMVILDLDHGPPELMHRLRQGKLADFEHGVHPTRQHSPAEPRLRIAVPLKRPVKSAAEYRLAARAIMRRITSMIGWFDSEASCSASQMMYFPTASVDIVFGTEDWPAFWFDGPRFDPDEVVVPVRFSDEEEILDSREQASTGARPETVVAANGLLLIEEALELVGCWEKISPDRWLYNGSTSGQTGGTIFEENGEQIFFSHHGSDPDRGYRRRAFDIIQHYHKAITGESHNERFKATIAWFHEMFGEDYVAMIAAIKAERLAPVWDDPDQFNGDRLRDAGFTETGPGTFERGDETVRVKDGEAVEDDDEPSWPTLSANEFAAKPMPLLLIEKMLSANAFACLYSMPGVGKSLLAFYIAAQAAQGRPVFGLKVQRPLRVLYVPYESPEALRATVKAYLKSNPGADLSGLQIPETINCGGQNAGTLFDPKLNVTVQRLRVDLVIIDTLSQSVPGLAENDAAEMGKVIARARSLQALGPAVLIVHHTTQADGPTPRGHSSLNAAFDVTIRLHANGEIVRATMPKNKFGKRDLDLAFRVRSVVIGEQDGMEVTGAYIEPVLGRPLASVKLTDGQRRVFEVLRRLLNGRTHVPRSEWRDASLGCVASDTPAGQRRAVNNHILKLRDKDVVVEDGEGFRIKPREPDIEAEDWDQSP